MYSINSLINLSPKFTSFSCGCRFDFVRKAFLFFIYRIKKEGKCSGIKEQQGLAVLSINTFDRNTQYSVFTKLYQPCAIQGILISIEN